ncbi:MAG: transaldolase, partial [Chloroflexota bacterium]
EQVAAKLTVIRTGVMNRQKLAMGIYAESVNKAFTHIDKDFVNERVWSKDASLWTSYNPERATIENRLGWLDVLETIDIERLKTLQANIKASDFEHLVLLGTGGSSLAAEVLFHVFGQQADYPALIVLDSTDPQRIREVEGQITLDKTLFIVASKSGTTVETMTLYRYFWDATGHKSEQFIAITDPETPLASIATDNTFRDVFLNPSDIGGRYSALSYFGMVPASIIGLDIDKLWSYADHMIEASHENIPSQYHPGINLGAVIGTLAKQGRDKLTLYSTQSLEAFGDWAEQLIAESLGKSGKGVVPVIGEQVASPAEYVTDRLFIYIRVDDDPDVPEMDEKIKALREAGHPRLTLRVPEPYAIAGEFFRWEFATGIAGHCMELNPFDEPNVAEAKSATKNQLDYLAEHGQFMPQTPRISGEHTRLFMDDNTANPLRELCRSHGYSPDSRTEVLAAQIAGTHAGDYFAILVYFSPSDAERAKLVEIQERMRKTTKRAVTIGYGPRYLHSTGQLHKGGANNGIFFLLTTNVGDDLAIPETDYTFGNLFQAQAMGDMETLQAHQRRVIRMQIDEVIMNGLNKLEDAVKFVEERRF